MKHLKCRFTTVLGLAMLAGVSNGRAQFNITGLQDRHYNYANSVTFTVNAQPGYSYWTLLDTNPIPTDVPITVNEPGYHELNVRASSAASGNVTNPPIRFIVEATARNGSENGLPPWTPYPTIASTPAEFAGTHVRLIAPQDFPTGYPIPVVAWMENGEGHAVRANGVLTAAGHPDINIRRGVGSGFLDAVPAAGSLEYSPQVGGLPASKTITLENAPAWTLISGSLAASTVWPENSRIHVISSLSISAGGTLTIGAGTIVIINSAQDINNAGHIVINGTADRPVVFMPAAVGQYWGGFIQHADNASFTATGAIFTGSGYRDCWFNGHECSSGLYNIGSHRGQQALISLQGANCDLSLTDCAAMYLHGQFSHGADGGSYSYQITLTRTLVQRCITGGEYSQANFNVHDSAFIEFGDDLTRDESPDFVDGDNDGLYITEALPGQAHGFTNTLFGWTKDDGVDSGGGGSGRLNFQDCWFDSILHEGNSLSGTGKDVHHYGSVFLNCGQGIEDGYDAPTGRVDRCLATGNLVGVRFGDNYDWTYNGFMWASNSILIHNLHDVWGLNWQSGSTGWIWRTNQMDIRSNWLSVPTPYHPSNLVWNAETDAWRLTNFMNIPLDAPVGMALAIWSDPMAMSTLRDGVPVRLSSFTTNVVSVDYAFTDDSANLLATGTLTFDPGETVKRIYPTGFLVPNYPTIHLALSNPIHSELTGLDTVTFQGSVSTPQMLLGGVTGAVEPGRRLTQGVFIWLNQPSAGLVRVDYEYAAGGEVLETGTFVFDPPETWHSLLPQNINPFDYDQVDVTLSNPVGATWTGTTIISFTNPPLALSFAGSGNQQDVDNLTNGIALALGSPAPAGISVEFELADANGVLTNGTFEFPEGQTSALLALPTVAVGQYDLLRLQLSNPVGAPLTGETTMWLVRVIPTLPPGPDETLVAWGSRWKYLDNGSNQGTAWQQLGFNDSGWASGPAQLGYGDGDEATVVSYGGNSNAKYITTYFRSALTVSDITRYSSLELSVLFDDGAVVYLNGSDVFRCNMPGGTITYTTPSLAGLGDNYTLQTSLSPEALQSGDNVVAVEVHQDEGGSSDISFDLQLIGIAAPVSAPQSLYHAQFEGQLVLAWGDSAFVLEEADDLTRHGMAHSLDHQPGHGDAGNWSEILSAAQAALSCQPPTAPLAALPEEGRWKHRPSFLARSILRVVSPCGRRHPRSPRPGGQSCLRRESRAGLAQFRPFCERFSASVNQSTGLAAAERSGGLGPGRPVAAGDVFPVALGPSSGLVRIESAMRLRGMSTSVTVTMTF